MARVASENNIDTITDDDLLEASRISDTQVGLTSSMAAFPRITFPNTPPIVLVSQLHSSVKNRTDVDKELDQLKQTKHIRIFKLLSGKNDYAIVTTEDYINCIRKLGQSKSVIEELTQANCPDLFERFIDNVLPNYLDVQIHKLKLLQLLFGTSQEKGNVNPKEEAAISILVNSGLLLIHEVNNFWFCIPHAGSFIASLVKGRKEIISVLKRQKFKEILQADLTKKKLRYSSLPMEFLIRDMSGLSIIERIPTTNGHLIRLLDIT